MLSIKATYFYYVDSEFESNRYQNKNRVAILNDQQLWFITRYICQEVDYQKVTRPSYILV